MLWIHVIRRIVPSVITMHFLFQLFGSRRTETSRPRCWIGVKVFGNEISVFTCEDLYKEMDQLSLSVAGLAVKLLKVYTPRRGLPRSSRSAGLHPLISAFAVRHRFFLSLSSRVTRFS